MTELTDLRAQQIQNGESLEGLRVNGTWFHVLRSFSHDKEIAKIGTMALAVYIVIKGHTDFQTGNAFPSIPAIAEQIGVTDDTIRLALKKLVKQGWLTVAKKGRNNQYGIVEKVHIDSVDGQRWATAQRKYVGTQFQPFVDELQRLVRTGNLPTDKNITINLTVNVQNVAGDSYTVINNDAGTSAAQDLNLLKTLKRL